MNKRIGGGACLYLRGGSGAGCGLWSLVEGGMEVKEEKGEGRSLELSIGVLGNNRDNNRDWIEIIIGIG